MGKIMVKGKGQEKAEDCKLYPMSSLIPVNKAEFYF